ncbi:MAG: helix-turn-helix domain-containing protein [Clostridia bacterium]|nr:helix-turn-helix domain-containing protein [Clostridia bacterium]
MRPINDKLMADILEAGRREFLEKGFQGASMRGIAASLGVTTGAIYRYYTDKAALLDALVEKPARELEQRYREAHRQFAELTAEQQVSDLPGIPEEQDWMLDFLYDHFDAFKLIACCAAGTKYEHYIDTLVEVESNSCRALIDVMTEAGMQVDPIDDGLIHILSNMFFQGIFEAVRHDMPRNQAMVYVDRLREFYTAGWLKILGISGR